MRKIMLPLQYLEDGYYVATCSSGEIVANKNLHDLYNFCVRELKNSCYMYHKYSLGHSSYSAKIYCPSGFKFEITVYDFAFYKGLAIERDNKTYYCAEEMR